MIEKLDLKINVFEERIGLIPISLIVGLLITSALSLYLMPYYEAVYHGLQYSLLSNAPFDFTTPNALRYRILPSLIGYLTFLRGDHFFIVPLIFTGLFFAGIYWAFRKKSFTSIDSFLIAFTIAFSYPLLIQLVAQGYTDSVFYFFLLLSFALIRKPYWSALFFALGLFTHESCLFMLPFLMLYSFYINRNEKQKVMKYCIALLVSIIPLLIYRYWVAQNVAVEYGLDFYFSEKNLHFTFNKVMPHLPLGLFFVFKALWLVPIYLLWKSFQTKDYLFALILLLILIVDIAQLFIAFDITRMLFLGFPMILLSIEKLREQVSLNKFRLVLLCILLINFLIPPYFMTCEGLVPLQPFYLQ